MFTFRPDVTIYPAGEFFPGLGRLMVSEDFRWAMWHAAGTSASAEAALSFAKNAAEIARASELERPKFPAAILVPMPAGAPVDPHAIPLLISRHACGTLILGILSDARPDSTNNP